MPDGPHHAPGLVLTRFSVASTAQTQRSWNKKGFGGQERLRAASPLWMAEIFRDMGIELAGSVNTNTYKSLISGNIDGLSPHFLNLYAIITTSIFILSPKMMRGAFRM